MHDTYSRIVFAILVGYCSSLAVIWWLGNVTVIGTLLLAIWTALPWLVAGLATRWMQPVSAAGILFLPLLWVLAEWLRSLGYTSFAWCQLAHPLWKDRSLLQLSAMSGTWGLSWLVGLVNLGMTILTGALPPFSHEWCHQPWSPGYRRVMIVLAYVGVFFPILGYVQVYQHQIEPDATWTTLRIGAVQGNFGLDDKHSTEWEIYLERYRQLSLNAAREGAELIVWPESTVVHPIRYWYSVTNTIQSIVDEAGVPILVGAVDGRNPDAEGEYLQTQYNAALLWSPGAIPPQDQVPCNLDRLPQYNKRHLVPFGETVPFGNYWPFSLLESVVEQAGGGIFEPGTEATLFPGPKGTQLGVAICFESTLESQLAVYRRLGAQFLVIITNDAWFRRSPGPEQHLLQSTFRAAENRCPVVRVANTGITCFIDHRGQITARLPWYEPAYLVHDIQVPPETN